MLIRSADVMLNHGTRIFDAPRRLLKLRIVIVHVSLCIFLRERKIRWMIRNALRLTSSTPEDLDSTQDVDYAALSFEGLLSLFCIVLVDSLYQ